MSGHGHVKPNADGSVARCGGPAVCRDCALEAVSSLATEPTLAELKALIKRLHTYVRDIAEVKPENFHPNPLSPEKLIEFMKEVATNAKSEIDEKYGNPWETWK
jgi:hypothetical protein